MAANKTFVVSDESVNDYGIVVLTSGGNFERFKKNPVGFFNHNKGSYDSNYTGSFLRWENLQINGSIITAQPVFYKGDVAGDVIADKVAQGFINTASMGILPINVVENPLDNTLVVTEWELYEISLTDIPSNGNAVAFYTNDNKKLDLKTDADVINFLSAIKEKSPKENPMKIKLKKAFASFVSLFTLPAFVSLSTAKEGEEVEVTEDMLQSVNDEIISLQSAVTTKDSTITDLQRQLTTLKSSLDAGVLELTTAKASIETLKGEKTSLETALATEKADLKTLVDHCKSVKIGFKTDSKNPVFNDISVELSSEEKTHAKNVADREEIERKIAENKAKRSGQ